MRKITRFFALTLLLCAFLAASAGVRAAPADGKAGANKTGGRPLVVLTKPIAPFVMRDPDGRISGFSMELWQALAKRLGAKSEIVMLPSLKALLDNIHQGAGDAGIAAVTITAEREKALDFSHPYFRSGLQIMVRAQPGGVLSRALAVMRGILNSPSFRFAMMALGLFVLVVAHVIWLAERRRNPQFCRHYPAGLWDAVYWTLVTISTVGYGDKTPKTNAGRAIALALIIFGYVAFAWFTATITSALTVTELAGAIRGPDDLAGKQVATVRHSTSEKWLRQRPGVHVRAFGNILDAYAQLEAGKVDAIVYDYPVLSHYARTKGRGKVRMTGPVFNHEPYGVIFPEGSPLREKVNQALLELMESGEYRRMHIKWFGEPPG